MKTKIRVIGIRFYDGRELSASFWEPALFRRRWFVAIFKARAIFKDTAVELVGGICSEETAVTLAVTLRLQGGCVKVFSPESLENGSAYFDNRSTANFYDWFLVYDDESKRT